MPRMTSWRPFLCLSVRTTSVSSTAAMRRFNGDLFFSFPTCHFSRYSNREAGFVVFCGDDDDYYHYYGHY